MFFWIRVEKFMLSVHLVLEICGLKVVVSFNFALSAPHVKRRVKSCEPSTATATDYDSFSSAAVVDIRMWFIFSQWENHVSVPCKRKLHFIEFLCRYLQEGMFKHISVLLVCDKVSCFLARKKYWLLRILPNSDCTPDIWCAIIKSKYCFSLWQQGYCGCD